MKKIKMIILFLMFSLLLFPATVYALEEVEEIEEIEETEKEIIESVNGISLSVDTSYVNSNSEFIELNDRLNDFFVSVCLEESYRSGFITEDDSIFIVSSFNNSTLSIYKDVYSYSSKDGDICGLGVTYRRYIIGNIFIDNFSGFTYSMGSAQQTIAKSNIVDNSNTSPYRYYSNFLVNGKSLRNLPEKMTIDEAYNYYFKKNNSSGGTTNITIADFTETNKILKNIFVVIVFVVLYAWFLNPCVKLLIGKEN